jgi:thiamine-phosphate pyrophosphorylase
MPRLAAGLHRFYPIVADAVGVSRMARLGAGVVQLRIKDRPVAELRREIERSLAAVGPSSCQLIVNDHWREALDAGADYVHLGQEDLAGADVAALRSAGVRIGISTHDHTELRIALAHAPDYVALGPIFGTRSKAVSAPAQGLERITEWRALVGEMPLVAIGGITLATADAVIGAGADSVAVISDLGGPDDDARVVRWISWSTGANAP